MACRKIRSTLALAALPPLALALAACDEGGAHARMSKEQRESIAAYERRQAQLQVEKLKAEAEAAAAAARLDKPADQRLGTAAPHAAPTDLGHPGGSPGVMDDIDMDTDPGMPAGHRHGGEIGPGGAGGGADPG